MKVSKEDMQALQSSGFIVAIDRADLRPSASGNPLFKRKENGMPLPVYVSPGLGGSYTDAPDAKLVELPGGKHAIFINEGYHKWSEAYVRRHIMPSLELMKQFQGPQEYLNALSGQATDKAVFAEKIEKPALQLVDAVKDAAKSSGIDNLHVVISDRTQHAGVITTREGNNFLLLNPGVFVLHAIKADAKEEFIGMVGHELAHIKNGHTLPASLIKARNAAEQRRSELEADLTAPAITGNNSTYLKSTLGRYIVEYNKEHPDKKLVPESRSLQDMKKVSDWLYETTPYHPPTLQRIAGMEIQAALQHGLESNAARHGRKLSDKDRQDNAAWVIKQVLHQYDSGTLPEPASMKPLPSLPEHVMQQVQGVGKLPMSEAATAAKPVTPSAPAQEVPAQERR